MYKEGDEEEEDAEVGIVLFFAANGWLATGHRTVDTPSHQERNTDQSVVCLTRDQRIEAARKAQLSGVRSDSDSIGSFFFGGGGDGAEELLSWRVWDRL